MFLISFRRDMNVIRILRAFLFILQAKVIAKQKLTLKFFNIIIQKFEISKLEI